MTTANPPRQKKAARTKVSKKRQFTIEQIAQLADTQDTLLVKVSGTTPLLPHKFSEKAKRQMLAAQIGEGRARTKDPKVPIQDGVDSLYVLGETPKIPEDLLHLAADDFDDQFPLPFLVGSRFGIPATALKQSMIRAGKGLGLVMTDVRSAVYIPPTEGDLVEVFSTDPWLRGDYVRVSGGKADLRFRVELRDWTSEFELSYVRTSVSEDQVLQCLASAGRNVGVGDWRPEKDGIHGTFRITEVAILGG